MTIRVLHTLLIQIKGTQQQFSHLTGYFVYGPACSFRLKIAPIYFLLSVISLASFVLLKYFQLFGCSTVREVVVQFVLKGHFLKK